MNVSSERWRNLVVQMQMFLGAASELQRDRQDTIAFLRHSLYDVGERRTALLLLLNLHPSFIPESVDLIVQAAVSHRDALLSREVLGRLTHRDTLRLVPPVVNRMLDEADDDVYRRLAELLDHLGLYEPLRNLCHEALRSADPQVQEVGRDFMGRGQANARD